MVRKIPGIRVVVDMRIKCRHSKFSRKLMGVKAAFMKVIWPEAGYGRCSTVRLWNHRRAGRRKVLRGFRCVVWRESMGKQMEI